LTFYQLQIINRLIKSSVVGRAWRGVPLLTLLNNLVVYYGRRARAEFIAVVQLRLISRRTIIPAVTGHYATILELRR